jgi:hypothetical protein
LRNAQNKPTAAPDPEFHVIPSEALAASVKEFVLKADREDSSGTFALQR